MKKKLKIFLFYIIFVGLISGCGVKNSDDIMKKLIKKQESCNSYYAEGTMEIVNNENTYTYDVKVSYKKKDYYKIDLINTLNNHEQVILRNDEGVYVVTPSLNKSFKFQSDWPYNNSQVYLLNSILEDLSEDEDRVFKVKDNGYYFVSSVNYPNNKSLVKQNVYVDKDMKIKKVEVTDKDGKVQITMNFTKIVYNKKFSNDFFELSKLIKLNNSESNNYKNSQNDANSSNNDTTNTTENNTNTNNNQTSTNNNQTSTNNNQTDANTNNSMDNNTNNTNNTTNSTETNENNEETGTNNQNTNNNSNNKQTANINDVIYPMYLPSNTTLANKEVINTDDGERLILTFSGDNPFVLVEETVSYSDEGLIVPVSGNLDFLNDVIGVINDNSVTFESNGIGYYIVSDKLEKTELVNIARSISVLPVSK